MIQWELWKCHCSSIGILRTEPQTKKEKEAGELSQTAKSYLKGVYGEFKYGRRYDFRSRFTDKGNLVENECITMLSRLDKEVYKKNEEEVENEFLIGTPDIYKGEFIMKADKIIDNKASWMLWNFLTVIGKPLDSGYRAQVQGYMAITGAQEGEVSYCLADCPESVLMEEKRWLLARMVDRGEAGTEYSPAYMDAVRKLEYMHKFGDIPIEERRVKFEVERDDEYIEGIYEAVKKGRKYLADFEKIHLNGRKPRVPAISPSEIILKKIK